MMLYNNLAENSMRPVAIGRRNWTHIGHQKAGPRIAAILSIVETCRRLKIPVRGYLAAVLPGLANTSIQRPARSHSHRLGRKPSVTANMVWSNGYRPTDKAGVGKVELSERLEHELF
jgi:hypothetical protein